MVSRRPPKNRLTPLFVCALGLALGLPVLEGRAPKASVLRFNITPVAGDTVFSDGLADSVAYQYADYRVAVGAQPVCVGAEATTTSFVFIGLNRALGVPIGNNNGPRCSAEGGTPRGWVVEIGDVAHPATGACLKLAEYDPDYVEWTSATTCRISGADNARMRFANLYANKLPAKTPIAFLISSFDPPPNHGGYEIKSETDATVMGNAATRYLSYDGTARLHEFIDRGTPVEAPFPLRMHAEFVKSTVQ